MYLVSLLAHPVACRPSARTTNLAGNESSRPPGACIQPVQPTTWHHCSTHQPWYAYAHMISLYLHLSSVVSASLSHSSIAFQQPLFLPFTLHACTVNQSGD